MSSPGTGFLLNNELTDFGNPGHRQQPAPGKRPRSSMSADDRGPRARPVLVTGAAGGATIIMGPTQAVIDAVDFGMTLPQAVDAERIRRPGLQQADDSRTPASRRRSSPNSRPRVTRCRPQGEYGPTPRMQLAGLAPGPAGLATAVSDSRSDRGALAVPASAPPPAKPPVR